MTVFPIGGATATTAARDRSAGVADLRDHRGSARRLDLAGDCRAVRTRGHHGINQICPKQSRYPADNYHERFPRDIAVVNTRDSSEQQGKNMNQNSQKNFFLFRASSPSFLAFCVLFLAQSPAGSLFYNVCNGYRLRYEHNVATFYFHHFCVVTFGHETLSIGRYGLVFCSYYIPAGPCFPGYGFKRGNKN